MFEIEKQVFISKTKNVLHNIGTCIRNVLYIAKIIKTNVNLRQNWLTMYMYFQNVFKYFSKIFKIVQIQYIVRIHVILNIHVILPH